MEAPWARMCVLDDKDDGNYVIPNQESVVVGGTHQHDDWDKVTCHHYCLHHSIRFLQTPRQEDSEFIFSGGCALEPSLGGAKHLRDWVGLRPGRASVKLERENLGGLSIVHNYGHGGSGITTFQVVSA